MFKLHDIIKNVCVAAIAFTISACEKEVDLETLRALDIEKSQASVKKIFIKPKSEDEIKKAYSDYLKNADTNDESRLDALTRLAELELNTAIDKSDGEANDGSIEAIEDKRINRTIELLETSLNDYPESKNNDSLLYQLARAYAQSGQHTKSIERLKSLVNNYPNSQYYAEAQFRLGENYFTHQMYSDAEFAYTEVIVSPNNDIFYEKSLFKRGWSRFKQDYYTYAIDDFLDTIRTHNFGNHEKLSKAELEQFNEYFRSLGLAFSYIGGTDALQEYFSNHRDFKYIYYTYDMVGKIYLKQERYSDSVKTYQQFIKNHPKSDDIPYARLKIIETWQKSGFNNKVYDAVDDFYVNYNPSSPYWKEQNENSNVNRVIRRSLKKYIILMTGYYHNKYQKTNSSDAYNSAVTWYERYLKHYSTYAQSDGIYFLYAELLSQNKSYVSALKYYEKAAYQDGLIINTEAAYATAITTDSLLKSNPKNKVYLEKHISYASKYAKRNPNEERTEALLKHAIEAAFTAEKYKDSIELADLYLNLNPNETSLYITGIKAESYFKLNEYAESESIFSRLLKNNSLRKNEKNKYLNSLALSIYKQGELASSRDDTAKAVDDFQRISLVAKETEIASTGLYDAIALYMQHKQWKNAIELMHRYQRIYPGDKRSVDISKKLSAAYLASNQGVQAAKEFVKLSSLGSDSKIKSAALWRAAELYEEKGQLTDAITTYEDYADKFKTPFPQYMEAMFKVAELYSKKNNQNSANRWRNSIIDADAKALNNIKTDRTKYVTSNSYLLLARQELSNFRSIELTLPLKSSLKRKKAAMQTAVNYYGKASNYKIFEIVTEATHAIATIYKEFSRSLLDSDRPTNLSTEELNQYEILLEDQAFPFEDKAIEFYEINLSRIKDGHYNDWIDRSYNMLIQLFPTRYKREPKEDAYIVLKK